MRRGGYDVRVLPEEDLGWEENPPTLIEFLGRDRRWCQGTLQYLFYIGRPGLRFVSRVQLLFAMLMFFGSPAWIGLLLVGTAVLATAPTVTAVVDARYGVPLLTLILSMWFCAQDRDDDRRSYPAGSASQLRRCRAVLDERRRGNRVLSVAFADYVGVPHAGTGQRAIRPRSRLERAGAREPRHRVVGRAAQVVASDGAWGCYSRDPRHSAAGGLPLCSCCWPAALFSRCRLCRHVVAMARHGNGSPGYQPPARGDRSAAPLRRLALPAAATSSCCGACAPREAFFGLCAFTTATPPARGHGRTICAIRPAGRPRVRCRRPCRRPDRRLSPAGRAGRGRRAAGAVPDAEAAVPGATLP